MFEDSRSKKIVLLSHCILNQNSTSDGTADYPGTFTEVVNVLVNNNVGILQMPCPELLCLGLDRGDVNGSKREVVEENTRIRQELLTLESQKKINGMVNDLIYQVKEYQKNNFTICGIIGVDRSPSCGVNTTSKRNLEVKGKGVFFNKLTESLKSEGMNIEMIGVKTSKTVEAVSELERVFGFKMKY